MNTSASMRHAHARRAICAALAALWAGHAAAQADPTTTPRAPRQRAPAARNASAPASTAPTAASSASLYVPLPPPPTMRPAVHKDAPSARATWFGVGVGGFMGFEGGSSVDLTLDAGVVMDPIAPNVGFELHVPVRFAFPGQNNSRVVTVPSPYFGVPATTYTLTDDTSGVTTEIVPTARLLFPRLFTDLPALTLYADGGLGLAASFDSETQDQIFAGRTHLSHNAFGVAIRVAAGVSYALTDRVRLTVQPIGFGFEIGPPHSSFELSAGLAYRL